MQSKLSGKNFHPDFNPELTPKRMLELGVFGGKYMTACGLKLKSIGGYCSMSAEFHYLF